MCINQTDLAERNAQVAEMRTIYMRAQSVVVFLEERGKSIVEVADTYDRRVY